jgi:hypothetical protein
MQILFAIAKFLSCVGRNLFWGKSWITGIPKIIVWLGGIGYAAGFSPFPPTDKAILIMEDGTILNSLQIGHWVLIIVAFGAVMMAIGAACVQVKSRVFKVGEELEPDQNGGIFRLSVQRWGWFVGVEAPAATAQRVVDAQGNSVLPALPFELIWSHQYPLGTRPLLNGRGPRKVDVFIVDIPNSEIRLLCLCGINGNRLSLPLGKFEKLWLEISVAEFTRWFSMERDPASPMDFRVTADRPPCSRRNERRLWMRAWRHLLYLAGWKRRRGHSSSSGRPSAE